MTSSTSNFEPKPASAPLTTATTPDPAQSDELPPLDLASRRRAGAYTVLWGGLTIALAMLLVNAGIALLRYQSLNPFSVQRIQTAAANLDAALALPADDPREVVYVLGSSLVHFGFSPDLFDAQLNRSGRPTVSYNFGFGNADPSIHVQFARKLARTFAEHPGRVDRIIYEFAPHGSTFARAATSRQLDHAATAVLSSWGDIADTLRSDPEAGFELINTRVFRSGVPAEAITHMMSMPIKMQQLEATVKDRPEPEPMGDLGWDLFHQLRADWPESIPFGGWSEQYRGGFPPSASDRALELSEAVMARMQDPVRMERSRQQRIACCDMLQLRIDPNMIADVIQTIKYAQQVAADVDIVIMPLNQDIVEITASGMANFDRAMDQIVAATGVEIIDLYKTPRLGIEYFFDVDHYTPFKGREKVTGLLADYYEASPDTVVTTP